MDELSRRAALTRFAAVTAAGWYGLSAPAAVALRTSTLRAFADLHGVRDPARALHRQSARVQGWAAHVLDALEHAPADGRFSHLDRAARAAALRSLAKHPDRTDRLYRPRAADAHAPHHLGAANRAAVAQIRHHQRETGTHRNPRTHLPRLRPRVKPVPRATGGPLDTRAQQLRQLRGSTTDLATLLRRSA